MAFVIPFIFRICGAPLDVNLGKIPFFGPCINELSSAGNFVHPVLVIIMYMGAFSPKIPYVGRLMSIRKELSIIVGFPVLAHGIKRLFASFPGGWQYFFNNEEYMQNPRVTSALGSGISSFVYVLGLVMFILFLVLWVTSFDSVHRKLGAQKWKSVQRWSYGLYAMLFIHALGLNVGNIISTHAREAQQKERTEQVAAHTPQQQRERPQGERAQQGERPQGERPAQAQQGHGQQPQAQQGHGQQPQAQQGGHPSRPQPFKFTEIEISRTCKAWIHIFTLFLIYGSYLFFRLRLRKERAARRAK